MLYNEPSDGLLCPSKGVKCSNADVFGGCIYSKCVIPQFTSHMCTQFQKPCKYALADGVCTTLGRVCLNMSPSAVKPVTTTHTCPQCRYSFEEDSNGRIIYGL